MEKQRFIVYLYVDGKHEAPFKSVSLTCYPSELSSIVEGFKDVVCCWEATDVGDHIIAGRACNHGKKKSR